MDTAFGIRETKQSSTDHLFGVIIVSTICAVIAFFIILCCCWKKREKSEKKDFESDTSTERASTKQMAQNFFTSHDNKGLFCLWIIPNIQFEFKYHYYPSRSYVRYG
ncbi:hypothetical protein BLA29_010539 [Euroglyphus maynei]|uniref:Uncharacterized protein n=1 Tax=Euroglyphus maynei TaxID=6958 RepID=A0A1Y3AUC3_EURMA|nr:hypothetical protein BLA29_010539 [Euroglyphus maynei]